MASVTWEDITQSFTDAGWEVESFSEHLLIGRHGELAVLAYEPLTETEDPVYELYDAERDITYQVREVPTPKEAAMLLAEYGEPPEEPQAHPYDRRADTEENNELSNRLFSCVNSEDLDRLEEIVAPDVVDREVLPETEDLEGIESIKRYFTTMRGAFPDMRITVDDMLAEGDKVAVHFTMRGTHRGELLGLAPTGNSVEVAGASTLRVAGGMIVEHQGNTFDLGMFHQLGAVPSHEQTEG